VSIHRLPKRKLTIFVDAGTTGVLFYHLFAKEQDGFRIGNIYIEEFCHKMPIDYFSGLESR
jgi:hypothetical protein